jgi:hypothetical protein
MKQQQFVFRSVVQSAFLSFCISGTCGCSAIGFGLGVAIDNSRPDKETIPVGTAMNLKPGDEIQISLVDSKVVEGVYKESILLDSTSCISRCHEFLDSVRVDVTFPKPGDTLFLHMNGTKLQFPYLFRGYGTGYLKLLLSDKSLNTTVAFADLTGLENREGKMFDLGLLERMSNACQPPGTMFLVVQTSLGTQRVPLEDIEHVEKPNSKYARWIGLGIGAPIDIIVVVWFFYSWQEAMRSQ